MTREKIKDIVNRYAIGEAISEDEKLKLRWFLAENGKMLNEDAEAILNYIKKFGEVARAKIDEELLQILKANG